MTPTGNDFRQSSHGPGRPNAKDEKVNGPVADAEPLIATAFLTSDILCDGIKKILSS
jgi:hypothetical protein